MRYFNLPEIMKRGLYWQIENGDALKTVRNLFFYALFPIRVGQ